MTATDFQTLEQTPSFYTASAAHAAVRTGYDYEELYKKLKAVDEHDNYTLRVSQGDNLCAVTLKPAFSRILKFFKFQKRLQELTDEFSSLHLDIKNKTGALNILAQVSALEFQDFILEKSFLGALIIKLKFDGDIILIINIPPADINTLEANALFTLEENRTTIVSNYGSIKDIVRGMNSYLKQ